MLILQQHKKLIPLFTLLLLVAGYACKQTYVVTNTETSSVRINGDSLRIADSAMLQTILPYKRKMEALMNEVIGITVTNLEKEQPEGTLNNLMTDACIDYATYTAGKPANIAFLNYGGIRIPRISAGDITRGKIFELMPFDNQLVWLRISGSAVSELIQLSAQSNGWPMSGVKMKIVNGKAEQILINGQPLDTAISYSIITSDYLAGGGDKTFMLTNPIERVDFGYLLRDAIIDYVRKQTPLNLKKDGRISY
jgi:2',3'-cyclic-nucleotide 2'-phosphodiesterase (5'-nucleotidase family)